MNTNKLCKFVVARPPEADNRVSSATRLRRAIQRKALDSPVRPENDEEEVTTTS
jgi:hypothetical protein